MTRVAVQEKDVALTRRVLTVFTDEPGKEWDIEDLATILKEDVKRVRTAINNLRAANPEIAPKIKILVPGTLYRYDNGPVQEPERPQPPPMPKIRKVEDTELPPEQPVAEPVQQSKDDDVLLFRRVGVTAKGTIIAEDEAEQLVAIRLLDI